MRVVPEGRLDKVIGQRDAARRQMKATRSMLFQSRVGHPEHHPSWCCTACNELRAEIESKTEAER